MAQTKQTDHMDRPTGVRSGEELAADRIESYLREHLSGLEGPVRVRQYPGGASNLTYLLSFANRELVLRRPPFGTKAATAHDMGREYKVLSALSPHWPYAPRPLVYCADESVIGAAFYVMEHLRGIILRKDIPERLFSTPDEIRGLFEKLLNALAELHSLDPVAVGLGDLGKPQGYVRRQVLGWNKRYRAARTPDVPDCEAVMAWLEERIPPESERTAIIHNDFRLDNIVLDPSDPYRIIGVLDWEMCTVGDPLMDLGCTLGYWVQRDDPRGTPHHPHHAHPCGGCPDPGPIGGPLWPHFRNPDGLFRFLLLLRAVPARGDHTADLLPVLPWPNAESPGQNICSGGSCAGKSRQRSDGRVGTLMGFSIS